MFLNTPSKFGRVWASGRYEDPTAADDREKRVAWDTHGRRGAGSRRRRGARRGQSRGRRAGRSDGQITARAGYAGGNGGKGTGDPCYHNLRGQNDYGKLGHAEVVNLKAPAGAEISASTRQSPFGLILAALDC